MRRTDDERRLKKYLTELTATVAGVVERVDTLMQEPHSRGRDEQLARIMNVLELANDSARHFGLGQSLTTRKRANVEANREVIDAAKPEAQA
jgi:hypothetical protein